MIIQSVKIVRTRDISHYAWARIAKFQNIDHTTSLIQQLHSLGGCHRENARRQAEQIKYCLAQAREYYDAARTASLATRPVLFYYSVMSMALAEVLLKQTADSRLAALRTHHNCHGLQLSLSADPKHDDTLSLSAEKLVAKPQVDSSGNPRGTFEVWRRSSREYPAGGYQIRDWGNGTSQRAYTMILTPTDSPPPIFASCGMSLLSCLIELPYMAEVLASLGSRLRMVRSTLQQTIQAHSGSVSTTMIVHPSSQDLIDAFGQLVVVDPAAVNTIQINELPSGYIVTEPDPENGIREYPHSVCYTDEDIFFSCSRTNLNEFGLLYVAIHICGNFARYYPDIWLKHIEKSSPLALAIDELCLNMFDRLPLLMISELERTYHVVAK
jgi:hypothetical protein